jgi:hypothetical protein
MASQDELIGMMQLTVSLLCEVNDRLQQLCTNLPSQEQQEECTAISRDIVCHLACLSQHLGTLITT